MKKSKSAAATLAQNIREQPKTSKAWRNAAMLSILLNIAQLIVGLKQYQTARESMEWSQRPYVLAETAFWRNGLDEAVVQFRNSGKSPAYHDTTQIHFFATTEKSDNQKLDWDHMLPPLSDGTTAPGARYNTPAFTRLKTVGSAKQDIQSGVAEAFVYGTVRYHDGFDKKYEERFCWMFDAIRSPAFFGCPQSFMH